jgi:uridylate kinase
VLFRSLRALEIDAQIVIKATKVDGVYDKDPMIYPDAVKYDRLSYDEVLQRGLRVMDAAGIALAKEDKLPIMVFNMGVAGNIRRAALGENVGTLITA